MKTRTGLVRLLDSPPRVLRKARIGLAAHAASVLPDLTHAVYALLQAGFSLTALFAPEHGLDGAAAAGQKLGHATEKRTGLPIFSLYGETREPTEEMLNAVDVLLFDMQDVGARFYTYISTLFYLVRASGQYGKPLYVLDRPNPITGTILEGGGIQPGLESFIGISNLPVRHGMTPGELANFFNQEHQLNAEVHVLTLQQWRRNLWFDQTSLLWVPPSPAMPHLSTAVLYPGMCLLEGTPLSLGRGTSLPFEICGMPEMDNALLADELNRLQLPGVRFRPIVFTPSAFKYAGQECRGIQVHVTNRETIRPVTLVLHLLAIVHRIQRDRWAWSPHFDHLTGSEQVRLMFDSGASPEQVSVEWKTLLADFLEVRERYLLYS